MTQIRKNRLSGSAELIVISGGFPNESPESSKLFGKPECYLKWLGTREERLDSELFLDRIMRLPEIDEHPQIYRSLHRAALAFDHPQVQGDITPQPLSQFSFARSAT